MIKAVFSASLLQSSVSHDLQNSFYYADLLFNKYLWLLFSIFKTEQKEPKIRISLYKKTCKIIYFSSQQKKGGGGGLLILLFSKDASNK